MLRFCVILGIAFALPLVPAQAQERGKSAIHIPDSSIEDPSYVGVQAHTNHLILANPEGGLGPGGGMKPAQIQSFYTGASYVSGGAGIIAIVDAYDYPTALTD